MSKIHRLITRAFYRRAATVLLFVLGCGSAYPASAEASRIAKMGKAAQSAAKTHGFVGSLLVAEGDTILVNTSVGFADLNSRTINTPNSKFRIGSLTKQFTASLVLLLQQEGKLRLDDQLCKYLPEFPFAWRSITIENLLDQTSGIPDFTDDARFGAWAVTSHSHGDEIELISEKALTFQPGTKFDYSNSNYILLGAVIEKVTKHSYASELKRHILDPLQMYDSGLDADGLTLCHRALGYRNVNGELASAPSESMSIPWAAGGMYSTTHDLLTWLRALFQGKLLLPSSLRAMTTARKGNYGLGLCIGSKHELRAIWHDGGIEGFNSYMTYLPDRQIAIIVLANVDGDSADALSSQLLDLTLVN